MLSRVQDNLFFESNTHSVVISLIDYAAFNGSFKTNPFNFQTFGLTYLSLSVDGRVHTGKPITMDFDRSQYVGAFFGTNLAMGLINKDAGNEIVGFKVWLRSLRFWSDPKSVGRGPVWDGQGQSLAIELKFSRVLAAPIQVIVYAELDSVLEVSKTRQLLISYTAWKRKNYK